jgi:hypothetical protein
LLIVTFASCQLLRFSQPPLRKDDFPDGTVQATSRNALVCGHSKDVSNNYRQEESIYWGCNRDDSDNSGTRKRISELAANDFKNASLTAFAKRNQQLVIFQINERRVGAENDVSSIYAPTNAKRSSCSISDCRALGDALGRKLGRPTHPVSGVTGKHPARRSRAQYGRKPTNWYF